MTKITIKYWPMQSGKTTSMKSELLMDESLGICSGALIANEAQLSNIKKEHPFLHVFVNLNLLPKQRYKKFYIDDRRDISDIFNHLESYKEIREIIIYTSNIQTLIKISGYLTTQGEYID